MLMSHLSCLSLFSVFDKAMLNAMQFKCAIIDEFLGNWWNLKDDDIGNNCYYKNT